MKKSKHTPESLIEDIRDNGLQLEGSLYETLGKDAVPFLQNTMEDQAYNHNGGKPSERFTIEPNKLGNGRIITDTLTGKSVEVGLCYLPGAIAVLNTFFDNN